MKEIQPKIDPQLERQQQSAFDVIRQQREFSQQMADLFGGVLKKHYPGILDGVDIGSYSRGTNLDTVPDIDPMFLCLPTDIEAGLVDWTNKDTKEKIMQGKFDGISNLEQLVTIDSKVAVVVQETIAALGTVGTDPQFNWLRTWDTFPGFVFNVEVAHPEHGRLEFDVHLYHPKEYFGVEHAQRFNKYIDTVAATQGEAVAVQVLTDIKRLKAQTKAGALVGGKTDKTRKVPGFITETLFTGEQLPRTYDEVIAQINAHTLPADVQLSERIQDQYEQLVGADKTVADVLTCKAITKGGYNNLKMVAQSQQQV